MNKKLKIFALIIGAVIAFVIIAIGSFHIYRWFNYQYGYEKMVINTIHKEVKSECLNN